MVFEHAQQIEDHDDAIHMDDVSLHTYTHTQVQQICYTVEQGHA